ncbi:MAG: tRNA (guanosine(46)-N7)-methyltransferase TrmB [Alphaproteobacteria bacterium]|nr:tRNA (guanosine(46)-N7)-methyltransferase TrmB [Alphaproteobacteria bacterium]MBQ3118074.1 tRNA (guanosine(46)-N7)-methyltransferase TrmB [Alphaproteobacteria bacterium]
MTQTKELKFFGRRKGKAIKQSKQKLIDELLPRLKPTLPEKGTLFDMNTFFGIQPKEIWLEVGFGGGEHVAELAQLYPDIGFIGAEPFMNGVASLLAHLNGSHEAPVLHTNLADGRTDNVRIWPDDVREMFPFFKDGLFKRIFVLYPDPWPKARHAERRFINSHNLKHLYRLLADDGQIFVATDVAAYAEWAVEQVELDGQFKQVNHDTSVAPVDWVPTRYEKKGILAGRQPIYLVFSKKNTK